MGLFKPSLGGSELSAQSAGGLSAFVRLVRKGSGKLVVLVELTGFAPSDTPSEAIGPELGAPELAQRLDFAAVEEFRVFRLSDSGLTTGPGDSVPDQFYEPLLLEPPTIDRELLLDVRRANFMGQSFGSLRLINPRGVDGAGFWDALVKAYSVNGQSLRVLLGEQVLDRDRGLWLDQPYDDFGVTFGGLAQDWHGTENGVEVQLRDATLELERAIQSATYGGGGGLDGDAAIKGLTKPMVRGSVPGNITPVLIDAAKRIYQYTDFAGSVVNLYEDGMTGVGFIEFEADTSDLWSGATTAGKYRTDDSKGLFQLGLDPVGEITLDATGNFETAGYQSTPATIARYLLTESLGLSNLDVGKFSELDSLCNYTGSGLFVEPIETSAIDVIAKVLRSCSAQLGTDVSGRFRPYRLELPSPYALSEFGEGAIVGVQPLALPDGLAPAVKTWRIGFATNHTVQTGGLNPAVSASRRDFLSRRNRFAVGFSESAAKTHKEATDAGEVETILQVEAHAEAEADHLGVLYSGELLPYDLTMGIQVLERDIGETIRVTWPIPGLVNGANGRIIRLAARPDVVGPVVARIFA